MTSSIVMLVQEGTGKNRRLGKRLGGDYYLFCLMERLVKSLSHDAGIGPLLLGLSAGKMAQLQVDFCAYVFEGPHAYKVCESTWHPLLRSQLSGELKLACTYVHRLSHVCATMTYSLVLLGLATGHVLLIDSHAYRRDASCHLSGCFARPMVSHSTCSLHCLVMRPACKY